MSTQSPPNTQSHNDDVMAMKYHREGRFSYVF